MIYTKMLDGKEHTFITQNCSAHSGPKTLDIDITSTLEWFLNSPQFRARFVEREKLVEEICIDLRNRASFDYTFAEIAEFIRTVDKED